MTSDVDDLVRQRLRALRQDRGWSLDDLANRSGVGASTISRIETGRRSVSLDVVVPMARELGVAVDELVTTEQDDDVVIRPESTEWGDMTVWSLSRPGSSLAAYKVRLDPPEKPPEPRVHPGRDWLFVLEGTVRLTLGDRTVVVEAGESAEFSTMTPHAVAAVGRPADMLMIFDSHGERAHAQSEG